MGKEKNVLDIPEIFAGNCDTSYNCVKWKKANAEIYNSSGELIYSNNDLNVPSDWSQLALNVVSSKYLADNKNDVREKGIDDLVSRVSDTIASQASMQGIISESDAEKYSTELKSITARQFASFNSPVWFNVGLNERYGISEGKKEGEMSSHWAYDFEGGFTNDIDAHERPQASACFIQSIDDDMDAILDHAKKEGMLFKYGSGTGSNFSSLRGYKEPLSGGGNASGTMSFMSIYDEIAASIQSGGKTRRAAKMVILDSDHPDIFRFVQWKANEEKKALWLSAYPDWAPMSPFDLDSEAYKTVSGQNGNNSVRVSNEFMESVEKEGDWELKFRTADRFDEEEEIDLSEYGDNRYLPDKRFLRKLTNKRKVVEANDLWDMISRSAYINGDPGLQYDDNINEWNTCKVSGRINASNPCSEFMFLDDSACNLASLRLTKFRNPDGSFNIDLFGDAVEKVIVAQETLVDYASYPSEKIAKNSHDFRPLGLGYTDMGALLMSNGIAYDSDEGRAVAGAITADMTGRAYKRSAELAEKIGPFERFEENKESMLEVLCKHRDAVKNIDDNVLPEEYRLVKEDAIKSWNEAIELAGKYGVRNSQVSLLAPTGTIGFMMDCDTTGIEPMAGLGVSKGLAGGGKLDLNSSCVRQGLETLGYEGRTLESILGKIDLISKPDSGIDSIVDIPEVKPEHYNVFATALESKNTISVDGHLKMMAAVQPFLSGAISKTVNLPKGSNIEDIKEVYMKSWKLGLKSVCPYVDGSKGVQPVNVKSSAVKKDDLKWGDRLKPTNPIERHGINVRINGNGVHLMVGEYDDRPPKDAPSDFFVEFGQAGSPFSSQYTLWAKELSRNRQRGASLDELIKHNIASTGTMSGMTDHKFIKQCTSIPDFLFKWVALEYLGDTSYCQVQPTPKDIANLRCNVLNSRNRVNHFKSRIEFIDSIMEDGKLIEILPLNEDKLDNGSTQLGQKFCPQCGSKMVFSGANCFKCKNCGHAPGCG